MQVSVAGSHQVPPGQSAEVEQSGSGTTQVPLVHVACGPQSELMAHPVSQAPVVVLHQCPSGQAETRQFDGVATHSCVDMSQSLPVPQAASLAQPLRQTPVVTSHQVRGAGHPVTMQSSEATHCPDRQDSPLAQAAPHVPQFFGSIRTSVQVPASECIPPSTTPPSPPGGTQLFATQTFGAPQSAFVRHSAGGRGMEQDDRWSVASAPTTIAARRTEAR
jgi:hypothetical protein